MNENKKIIITALVAMIISFAILFVYLQQYETKISSNANENFNFLSESLGKKRIFLIGVSYVNQINTTYVQHLIADKGLQQFDVYKIAEGGARPSVRVRDIDQIISNHPVAIFYGIGPSDIGFMTYPANVQPHCLEQFDQSYVMNNSTWFTVKRLPAIQDIYDYFKINAFSNMPDPNHITINILRSYFGQQQVESQSNNLASEFKINVLATGEFKPYPHIKNLDEINRPLDDSVYVCKENADMELSDLQTIVTKLKQANIKVVLFIPPFSQSYINTLKNNGADIFVSLLQNFAQKNNLKLYSLFNNYTELNIWSDPEHIAYAPQASIYSRDVGIIILNEMSYLNKLHYVDVSGSNVSYRDLSNGDLRSVDLSYKNMTGVNLENTNLLGANLTGTILKDADLSYAYLPKADLSGKDLNGTRLIGSDLSGANLKGVNLSGIDLSNVNLDGVDLSNKNLTGTILVGANLRQVNLTGVDLSDKNLTGTNLSYDNLSDKNLTGTILIGADLSYSKLDGVILAEKNLTGTKLIGDNLSYENLTGTVLKSADLSYSNLQHADLSNKDLSGTNLFNTNLSYSNLTGVDLSGNDLSTTLLNGAVLTNTKLPENKK